MVCRSCGKELKDGSKFCAECGAGQSGSMPVPAVKPDPRIGTTIEGKYRIDAQIGVGGMATVYGATRLLIGDAVALKILHAEQLRDPQAPERFRREAQAAARLKHPNAVSIFDFGISDDGIVYLVMELVEGQSLRRLIKDQGPLYPSAAAEILAQVCGALNEAHEQKVVHRDVKPDNIVVAMTPTGIRVKVLDFGIARLRDVSSLSNLTQTGSVMGTPHYMSPEQCLGEELDGRSDIYSLGIVLYEMLTGVVPFNSPTSMAVVVHHVSTAPAPLRILNSSVPLAVEAVVMRTLEKRREARPQTAAALANEFSAAVASLSAPAGHSVSTSPQTPAMMPTVQMRTPWSTGAAMPPQAPATHGLQVGAQQGQASRKRLPMALIGGATVVVAVALTWFLLSRRDAPPPPSPETTAASGSEGVAQVPPPDPGTSASGTLEPVPLAPPSGSAVLPPALTSSGNPAVRAPITAPPAPGSMTGSVTVRTAPEGEVLVDGKSMGFANREGLLVLERLTAGDHLVKVRKKGHRDLERAMAVRPGQSQIETLALDVLPGTLTLKTTAGAAISVDDGGAMAPVSSLELAPGKHSLKATKAGYRPVTKHFEVTAGEPTELAFELEMIPPAELLTEANKLIRSRQFDEARGLAGILLSANPQDSKANLIMGTALYRAGRSGGETYMLRAMDLGEQVDLDVMHNHAASQNCRGVLSISSKGLRYESDQSQDAFAWIPPSGILEVKRAGTWRVETRLAGVVGRRQERNKDFDFLHAGYSKVATGRKVPALAGTILVPEVLEKCDGCDGSIGILQALLQKLRAAGK